jgi:hypothetical protein
MGMSMKEEQMRISKEVAGAYVNVLSCISRGEPEKKSTRNLGLYKR